jgi:hypothetical protein
MQCIIIFLSIKLNDVPLGGATGYPLIPGFIQPEVGSIAVQVNHNFYEYPMKGYDVMSHGGCPVISGTKYRKSWN